MAATVRSICTGALRLLGVTQPGREPSAYEMETATYALRSMLENWSTQRLNVFQTTTYEFEFIPHQATYTLGPTGDWETERPMILSYAYLRYAQDSGTPIDMQITILNDAQRAAISAKTISSSIPTTVYYNPEVPDAKLTFWPVPTVNYKAILWCDAPLDSFTDLNDELQFPRGYEQALRYNLAVNLAPEFGRQVSQEIIGVASKSINDLKALNVTPRYLRCKDYASGWSRRQGPSPIFNMMQGR